jgi:hypothetical protein
VAGYMLAMLGQLPTGHETVEADGHLLTVLSMDGRRIARVRVDPAPGDSEAVPRDGALREGSLPTPALAAPSAPRTGTPAENPASTRASAAPAAPSAPGAPPAPSAPAAPNGVSEPEPRGAPPAPGGDSDTPPASQTPASSPVPPPKS